MRAAEINCDILKHEMENVRTEHELLKAQSDKQMQTISYFKQAQQRNKQDADFQRRQSKMQQRKREKMNATADLVSLNQSTLYNPADQGIDGYSMRFSIGPCDLMISTENQSCQVDIISTEEL